MNRDPIRFVDGPNCLLYLGNRPVGGADSTGLQGDPADYWNAVCAAWASLAVAPDAVAWATRIAGATAIASTSCTNASAARAAANAAISAGLPVQIVISLVAAAGSAAESCIAAQANVVMLAARATEDLAAKWLLAYAECFPGPSPSCRSGGGGAGGDFGGAVGGPASEDPSS